MKHIAGWFRRNKTLMAQLQVAWDNQGLLDEALREALDDNKAIGDGLTASNLYVTGRWNEECEAHDYTKEQLHRVARERDEWKRLRLVAEDMLLDYYLQLHELAEEDAAADRYYNEEE